MQRRDDELRGIIDAGMRAAVPDARAHDRMLAGLLAQLPAPPVVPEPTGGGLAGAIAAGRGGLHLIVGAVVGVVAVGVIAIVAPGASDDAAPRAVVERVDAPVPSSSQPMREAASLEPTPAPTQTPSPTPTTAPTQIGHGHGPAPDRPSPRTTSPVAPEPPPAPAPNGTIDLAAEAELIAQARAALDRGDTGEALAITARHAARHPAGQLAVERDAIAVVAACVAGKPTAADGARRFLAAHPREAAAVAVQARCASITKDAP